MHRFLWARRVVKRLRDANGVFYTRSAEIAYWTCRFNRPITFEVHTLPGPRLQWLYRALIGRGCRFVVLTQGIRQGLIDLGADDEAILVAPDAVNVELFKDSPSRKICRERVRLRATPFYVGYVGRFHTMEMEKGIPELIEAMGQIDDDHVHLLCVGGPMDRVARYHELARHHGVAKHRLHFHDRVPHAEVPLWMRACDVVTIPWPRNNFSAHYTSPMKMFEYMASGTPIIASDLPALREILNDKNARLVTPDDPGALATAIRDIHASPDSSNQHAKQARRDVEKHTWDKRARRILAFIQRS